MNQDILPRLVDALPHRFKLERGDYLASIDHGMYWSQVSLDGPWTTRSCLEYALREEIEERGWTWEVKILSSHRAFAYILSELNRGSKSAFGDTPAEALALSLLAALEAQP